MKRLNTLIATFMFALPATAQDATEVEALPVPVPQVDIESPAEASDGLSLQAPQQSVFSSDSLASEPPTLSIDTFDGSMLHDSFVDNSFVPVPTTEHLGPIEMGAPLIDSVEAYSVPLQHAASQCRCGGGCNSRDIMDVRKYSLLDYRRMFMRHRAPTPIEMAGTWRGVNKGIVRLVGIKQFIKEIQPCGSVTFGDNIEVQQVSDQMLRCCGWQPKVDSRTGALRRNGKYKVKRPNFWGPFGHGAIFSYREGGNRLLDPRRVIVDKVVLIDCNHLLGRASVRIGLIPIPVGYFVLERM